jgi:uncharacterized protein (TIGR01777 family)
MKILMTGATGFLGRLLWPLLRAEGHTLAVLARDTSRTTALLPGVTAFEWNGLVGLPPAEAFAGVDAIVNLIGEPIAKRWNADRKRRFRESRVLATHALVERLATIEPRPRLLVSMSAVGIYGDRGDEVLTERSALGNGFLAEMARDWEAAAFEASALGVRVGVVRSGVVLGREGGMLAKLLPIFRLGLGGRLGSGGQYVPWIHVDDLLRLVVHVLSAEEKPNAVVINGVAPEPVTNAELTAALGRQLHRPVLLGMPAIVLRLALGEMAEEVLLASQRVSPIAAIESGFAFRFPLLESALRDLLVS